ncbi:DUF2207 family protein [Microlunatus ginsengisoli]|uniref:DUF2207 family protein n=1 Tax=Microlunatus ginsengisoli TaxID=363863 RepID=UPI0031DB1A11
MADTTSPSRAATAHRRVRVRRTGAFTILAMLAAAAALLIGPLSLPAAAEGTASVFDAKAELAADGALRVQQTITFAGTAPANVSQTFELRQNIVGQRQYVMQLSDVTASIGGQTVAPTQSDHDRFRTVTVATGGANVVSMSYTVTGAVRTIDSGTALQWPLLQGLSAQVNEFTGTVRLPAAFNYLECNAGSPNSPVPCRVATGGTGEVPLPTFRDGPLGEGQIVAVDIGFAPGAVPANEQIKELWTVGRAFSAKPLPLGIALGLLVLGGLGLLAMHRQAGRDATAGEPARAGQFVPVGAGQTEFRVVGEVRPGEIGTLVDERVDPIDVTASLLDLAVRGHLLITELPRASAYARTDWELTRLAGPDALQSYEQLLLDTIAPVGGIVRVSELAGRVQDSIGAIQDKLYDEMVGHGWYERRPDSTRSRWTRLGLIGIAAAVVITALLALLTEFGLVGIALIALALGLMFVAQEMPSRTPKGAALLAGLGALRSDLMSHPTDQMPPGAELREISEVLPYAVVLGGADRWLDALVAADDDADADSTDLTWYHGPADWHLRDLPDSLRNFITTVSGLLFAR